MSKILKIFVPVFIAGLLFFGTVDSARAANYCFCYDDLSVINPDNHFDETKIVSTELVFCNTPLTASQVCSVTGTPKGGGGQYFKCDFFPDLQSQCKGASAQWASDKDSALKGEKKIEKATTGFVGAFIPECVVNPDQTCDDIGIFVVAGIKAADFLFGIVGALALLMFIYGGFVLILSQGTPEKVKQGTGIMMAAVIGLVIAFGGYILVNFLSSVLSVKSQFRLS